MRNGVLAAGALILSCTTAAPAATVASKSQTEIRALLNRWADAFRARDLDAIMAIYAPGAATVAYDIAPPLQRVGRDSYRKSYEEFFAMYDGPMNVEFRDLQIVAGNDVAFVYSLERMSGTLQGGQKSELWLRVTSGLRKIDGKWRITHDHVSVPVDFETGKALTELRP